MDSWVRSLATGDQLLKGLAQLPQLLESEEYQPLRCVAVTNGHVAVASKGGHVVSVFDAVDESVQTDAFGVWHQTLVELVCALCMVTDGECCRSGELLGSVATARTRFDLMGFVFVFCRRQKSFLAGERTITTHGCRCVRAIVRKTKPGDLPGGFAGAFLPYSKGKPALNV